MKNLKSISTVFLIAMVACILGLPFVVMSQNSVSRQGPARDFDDVIRRNASDFIEQGREIFRFDTFGDEAFWGDALKLHQAIAGSRFGGVGPGVSPRTALAVGLKVDSEALPSDLAEAIRGGRVDLDDPANTLALLRLNAVVGVTGFFDQRGAIRSIGIQCALCHSTVDDSFAPGIGRRLDGWASRDLNVGAIVSLAPDLSTVSNLLGVDEATVRSVLKSWGPGKFDAGVFLDGKAFRDDGKTAATLIPPAFGLAGVNLHTWTGWGSVTHWNAFVANLEMHGKGTFYDPRINNPAQFPVGARGFWQCSKQPGPDHFKACCTAFLSIGDSSAGTANSQRISGSAIDSRDFRSSASSTPNHCERQSDIRRQGYVLDVSRTPVVQ